jgi:glycosyltransferase involved in cell wall biosynthesis
MGAVVAPYEVVLATFHGEAFLDEQIASILHQTLPPLRLLVADDGSEDGTLSRLHHWRRRSAVPIELLPASPRRLGSCSSFERLLAASVAPYVMPADQDDVWDPDKAQRLLNAMAQLERRRGAERPLLVHAGMRLIDRKGQPLAACFHRHQGLDPHRDGWLDVALQNVVTGCACLLNRACIEQALPFPPEVVLHDGWLALVAAYGGGLAYLEQPCQSYRQHGRNLVGAAGGWGQLRRRLREAVRAAAGGNRADRWIGPGLRQLRALLQRRPCRADPHLEEQIAWIERLWSPRAWQRLQAALALRLSKHGLWRTSGFYLALLCWRPLASDLDQRS